MWKFYCIFLCHFRLPSYRQQGSRCPTIAHPSSKEKGQGHSKVQSQVSKSKQAVQQSNGQQAIPGNNII